LKEAKEPQELTDKEKAFNLFDRGFGTASPELKRIIKKYNTRRAYYYEWRVQHNLVNQEVEAEKPETKTKAPAAKETKIVKEKVELIHDKQPELEELWPEDKGGENEDAAGEQEEEPAQPEEEIKAEDEQPTSTIGGAKVSAARDRPLAGSKQIPTSIAGDGMVVTLELSVKTFALYQIARTLQRKNFGTELSMGDFVDGCVEDTYVGRGMDLGIIKTGENNGH